jgi:hypothetical protein
MLQINPSKGDHPVFPLDKVRLASEPRHDYK